MPNKPTKELQDKLTSLSNLELILEHNQVLFQVAAKRMENICSPALQQLADLKYYIEHEMLARMTKVQAQAIAPYHPVQKLVQLHEDVMRLASEVATILKHFPTNVETDAAFVNAANSDTGNLSA